MPALRLSLYAEGVDIWCAPTADARDVQLATMRHIAIEGRCFVLAANQFAQAKDLSPAFATTYDDPDQVVCRGASVIVNPFGEVLAGPFTEGEGLLVADLDLDQVTRGRYDFDASGHYSRPDIFTLVVDRHRSQQSGPWTTPRTVPERIDNQHPATRVAVLVSHDVLWRRRVNNVGPSGPFGQVRARERNSHADERMHHSGSPLCQERGFGALECAPVLVAVKVVRPVGRSTLTAPARRRGGC